MIQTFIIALLLYRFRTRMFPVEKYPNYAIYPNYIYEPYVFPEGCCPNISDPYTFEKDVDGYLSNINKSFIERLLNDDNESKWEHMIKFGIMEV